MAKHTKRRQGNKTCLTKKKQIVKRVQTNTKVTESNAIEATYRAFDERMKGKKRKKALPVAPAPLKPATFTLPVAPTVHDELDEYLEPILEADPPASPVCTKPEPTSLYSLREQTSNVFSVLNFDSEDETPTSQLKPATFVFPKSQ